METGRDGAVVGGAQPAQSAHVLWAAARMSLSVDEAVRSALEDESDDAERAGREKARRFVFTADVSTPEHLQRCVPG